MLFNSVKIYKTKNYIPFFKSFTWIEEQRTVTSVVAVLDVTFKEAVVHGVVFIKRQGVDEAWISGVNATRQRMSQTLKK